MGEKYVEVTDSNGRISWAKFQICSGLGNDKILASVSRLVQVGHSVVFRSPEAGSYIQNNTTGYRTYLRQENGAYYLVLWVKKVNADYQDKHNNDNMTRRSNDNMTNERCEHMPGFPGQGM